MKKLLISCVLSCLSFCFYAQGQQQQILKLAKDYRDYMFRNQPTKEVIKEIRNINDTSLAPTAEFIAQTITTKNNIFYFITSYVPVWSCRNMLCGNAHH